jgi:hypothetical protein
MLPFYIFLLVQGLGFKVQGSGFKVQGLKNATILYIPVFDRIYRIIRILEKM